MLTKKGLPKNEMLTEQAKLDKHEFRVAQKDDLTFCVWVSGEKEARA